MWADTDGILNVCVNWLYYIFDRLCPESYLILLFLISLCRCSTCSTPNTIRHTKKLLEDLQCCGCNLHWLHKLLYCGYTFVASELIVSFECGITYIYAKGMTILSLFAPSLLRGFKRDCKKFKVCSRTFVEPPMELLNANSPLQYPQSNSWALATFLPRHSPNYYLGIHPIPRHFPPHYHLMLMCLTPYFPKPQYIHNSCFDRQMVKGFRVVVYVVSIWGIPKLCCSIRI